MENTAPNLYDAIGISADASADEIKRKTRKLVNEVKESDKRNSEKNELIRFFKSARETLTDPGARKDYDESLGIQTLARHEHEADGEGAGPCNSVVSYETFEPFQPFTPRGPTGPTDSTGSMGPIGSIGSIGSMGPIGALGSIGSLLGPMHASLSSRAAASPLMELLGGHDMGLMFSDSIIPEEMATSNGDLKRGSFHVLEYTKVRNPDGGFDEFGFTRQGDMKRDRVTEKRFERKS